MHGACHPPRCEHKSLHPPAIPPNAYIWLIAVHNHGHPPALRGPPGQRRPRNTSPGPLSQNSRRQNARYGATPVPVATQMCTASGAGSPASAPSLSLSPPPTGPGKPYCFGAFETPGSEQPKSCVCVEGRLDVSQHEHRSWNQVVFAQWKKDRQGGWRRRMAQQHGVGGGPNHGDLRTRLGVAQEIVPGMGQRPLDLWGQRIRINGVGGA